MITYRKIPSNFKTENNLGLGNQMFFMASTIGIATKLGYKFGFESFYPEVFPNQAPHCSKFGGFTQVPWGYHDVTIRDGGVLYGYMQSEKYFLHCADVVRYYFEMYPRPFELDKDSICVHLRQGDYLKIQSHYRLGMDYYEKALRDMTGKIYVFSDEQEKAKALFGSNVEYPDGDVFDHFYMMRQCKKFVIANSSFSWWAAWLSGEEVTAPRNWFAGSNVHLDTKDLYCEGWKIV